MKRFGAAILGLVSIMALTAILPVASIAANKKVVEVEKTYRCLNPRGDFIPVKIHSLALRLDTLEGKTIYVNQGEADPVIMPALIKRLRADYPGTTWKYLARSDFGPDTPEEEVLKGADAVIRGVSW